MFSELVWKNLERSVYSTQYIHVRIKHKSADEVFPLDWAFLTLYTHRFGPHGVWLLFLHGHTSLDISRRLCPVQDTHKSRRSVICAGIFDNACETMSTLDIPEGPEEMGFCNDGRRFTIDNVRRAEFIPTSESSTFLSKLDSPRILRPDTKQLILHFRIYRLKKT